MFGDHMARRIWNAPFDTGREPQNMIIRLQSSRKLSHRKEETLSFPSLEAEAAAKKRGSKEDSQPRADKARVRKSRHRDHDPEDTVGRTSTMPDQMLVIRHGVVQRTRWRWG